MSTASEPATTLTFEDVQSILAQWKAGDVPTPEEQDRFMEDAISDLNDPEKAKGYQSNVEQVGIWANEVDESFDTVKRSLENMVEKHGKTFPELASFRDQWVGYNARWVTLLLLSRDVASQHVSILRRFDQVFLDMVESIVTDQDREDVIFELQRFIDEDHDDSDKMSKGFFALQADIESFLVRFDKYIEDKGTELAEQAEALRLTIGGLQTTIRNLNWEIAAAIIALISAIAGAATMVGLLGVFAAEVTLLMLLARRLEAEVDLKKAQRELAQVNAMQQALAFIKSEFDGLKPDISLICEKLGLFGDIWKGVRSDTIRFQTHLKKGIDAVNDERFRREIRLARSVCGPMQAGLEKYAAALDNRKLKAQDAEKTA